MRFALIGDHRDGWELAQALAREPGFAWAAYAGPAGRREAFRAAEFDPEFIPEVEELLARDDIPLVLVADAFAFRAGVLRRAVQSEKHVVCVHPADDKPDSSYEAGMIQRDTGKLLWPILPDRFTPEFEPLRQAVRSGEIGALRLIEVERSLPAVHDPDAEWDGHPLADVWDTLRLLGGDVVEVAAVGSATERLDSREPINLSGRLTGGALYRVLLTPLRENPRGRWLLRGERGEIEWTNAADGADSTLRRRIGESEQRRELPGGSPWPGYARSLVRALAGGRPELEWLDGVRCLEVLDAAAESVKRKRTVPLLYQDFNEAGSFKGLMTATGCGLIWVFILLVAISPWAPWILWGIPLLIVVFLGMQLFRWVVPQEKTKSTQPAAPGRAAAKG